MCIRVHVSANKLCVKLRLCDCMSTRISVVESSLERGVTLLRAAAVRVAVG